MEITIKISEDLVETLKRLSDGMSAEEYTSLMVNAQLVREYRNEVIKKIEQAEISDLKQYSEAIVISDKAVAAEVAIN